MKKIVGIRERMCRRLRKRIQAYGEITREAVLNTGDDGKVLPREQWGYVVEAKVNGRNVCAPEDNWLGAYRGCLAGAEWAAEQPPRGEREADAED